MVITNTSSDTAIPVLISARGGGGFFNARVGFCTGSASANDRDAVTDFGYFATDFEAVLTYRRALLANHPLNHWQRVKKSIDISGNVKNKLNVWLKKRKAVTLRRRKRDKKKRRGGVREGVEGVRGAMGETQGTIPQSLCPQNSK